MDGTSQRAKRRAQKWMQAAILCTTGCWLVGFSTTRSEWPGLVRPFSDEGILGQNLRKFAHLGGEGEVERRPPPSPDKLWAFQLRTALDRTIPAGQQAFLLGLASLATLLWGGSLLTESARPLQVAAWFAVGALISMCWALHPATAPSFELGHVRVQKSIQFVLAVACHGGTFFALFPEAATYVLGAFASVIAQHIVKVTVTLHTPNEAHPRSGNHIDCCWWQLSAALLGGCLCLRFRKPALNLLASSAGSAGLAVVSHWWMCLVWSLLRPTNSMDLSDGFPTPARHIARLASQDSREACSTVSRWIFTILWAFFVAVGWRLQQKLGKSKEEELSQWYQDQIRQAPSDSDVVPRWPDQKGPSLCRPLDSKNVNRQKEKADCTPSLQCMEEGEAPSRSVSAPLHSAVVPPQEEHDIYVPEGMEAPVLRRSRTTYPALQPVQETEGFPRRAASDRLPRHKAPSSEASPSNQRASPSGSVAPSPQPDRSLRRYSLGGRTDRAGRSISASSLSSVEAAAILGLPPRSAFRKTPA